MISKSIKVSILVITYNHKNYLEKCLESILEQKTTFPFEILIHDDVSTDGTTEIVKRYVALYPDKVRCILEEKNVYSQGISPTLLLIPLIRGQYVAFCEGDDFWSDPFKLQKQVDFLDTHPDYVACCHQVTKHNLYKHEDTLFTGRYNDSDVTTEEMIAWDKDDQYIHLNSMLHRRSILDHLPEYMTMKNRPVGDMPYYVYLTICGKVRFFAKPMSVYNFGIPGSWIARGKNYQDYRSHVARTNGWIHLYNVIDRCTGYKYHSCIVENRRRYEKQKLKIWIRWHVPLVVPIYKRMKQIFGRGGDVVSPLFRYEILLF